MYVLVTNLAIAPIVISSDIVMLAVIVTVCSANSGLSLAT